jgi:hypothetical protein
MCASARRFGDLLGILSLLLPESGSIRRGILKQRRKRFEKEPIGTDVMLVFRNKPLFIEHVSVKKSRIGSHGNTYTAAPSVMGNAHRNLHSFCSIIEGTDSEYR